MPRLMTDDMAAHTLPTGGFGFSAIKIDKLGATMYTLATIAVDESGSVSGFGDDLEKTIWAAVAACQLSAQKENILLRVVAFSDRLREVHGFRPLAGLTSADYVGAVAPNGSTALHEVMVACADATTEYAKTLAAQDFEVNATLFVLTDGLNNNPPQSATAVRDALKRAVQCEVLGTLTTVLIGINDRAVADHGGKKVVVGDVLQDLLKEAGLSQYVGLADATPKTLAKLGAFVSRSISSVSQALATGGGKSAPQPVTF